MLLSPKLFSTKLNHCLDETGAPHSIRERAAILSKLLDIPRQQAFALLEGHLTPDQDTLKRIATEFEVDVEWLTREK